MLKFDYHRVALLAVFSELPLVDVGVTSDATRVVQEISLGLHPRRRVGGLVALLTLGDVPVETQQRVARLGVIEFGRIPTHRPKILSLMLGMAADTVTDFVTMKAPAGCGPLGQVFVTSKTPVCLDPLSRGVAGDTVG